MSADTELAAIVDAAAASGELAAEDRQAALEAAAGSPVIAVPENLTVEPPAAAQDSLPKALLTEAEPDLDIRTALSKMNIPQKIKIALFGNAICRTLLIRDPNRMIQQFVLKNPKLTLKEVEEFAKNPNCSEWVLRAIAGNQMWTKSYAVKSNLVFNPKTPLDLSLKWVRFLNATDMKRLSKSKNVSQVLSTSAKKAVSEK